MNAQSFNCPRCKRYTRHIQITNLEYEAHYHSVKFKGVYSKTETIFGKVMGAIGDVSGIGTAIKTFVGIAPYKCSECGAIHKWNAEGEWIE